MRTIFIREGQGRKRTIKIGVLALLAVLLIGWAGRGYLPAAAEWTMKLASGATMLVLGADDQSKDASRQQDNDEPRRQRSDQREWLDSFLRLLRSPGIEL